jgi:NADP-dependent 3-hydroxy acid dehydrogenase YdfG
MSDIMEPMVHEAQLPGHESKLEPKPDWEPRYPGSGRLDGKVALITGADSGIGRAVAALYAREGADVAILYLCEHDDAAKTKEIVEKEGRRAVTIAGDLGDKEFCKRAVQQTVRELGRLDILVNNAGEQHYDEEIEEISEDQLKRTFQTNVFGMFFLTQAAMPHLTEGSAIINCTSETMYAGSPGLLDYSATKGAITAFTRSLALKPRRQRNPRERGGTGAHLDATQSVGRAAAGKDSGIWQGHAHEAPRPAERSGALLPVPGVRGFELYDGAGPASGRRGYDIELTIDRAAPPPLAQVRAG